MPLLSIRYLASVKKQCWMTLDFNRSSICEAPMPLLLKLNEIWLIIAIFAGIHRKRPIQKEVAAHFLLTIEKSFYKIIKRTILAHDATEQTTPILCWC